MKVFRFSILLHEEGTPAISFEHTLKFQLRTFNHNHRDLMSKERTKKVPRETEAEDKMDLRKNRGIKIATIPRQKRCRRVREVVFEGILWKKNYAYQQRPTSVI